MRTVLGRLIGEDFLDEFRRDVYQNDWLLRPGVAGELTSLVSWDDANDMLRLQAVRERVTVAQGATWAAGVDPGQLSQSLGDGATVILREVELLHAGVGRLLTDLSAELDEPTSAYLYLSQPGVVGLAPHYDPYDSIQLQLQGTKRWTIYPRTVTDPLRRARAGESPGEPIAEFELSPGDVLYLPAGFWHAPVATSESMHLNIKIQARPGADFVTWLGEQLLADPAWRRGRPLPSLGVQQIGADAATVEHYEDLIGRLAGALSDPDLVSRYLRHVALAGSSGWVDSFPMTGRPAGPVSEWPDDVMIARAKGVRFRYLATESGVELIAGGRSIGLPTAALQLLETRFIHGPVSSLGELRTLGSEVDLILDVLLAQGLLTAISVS